MALASDQAAATQSRLTPPRRQINVRQATQLVIVLAVVFSLVTMLARAVERSREAARRAQCLCNLCSIKLALENYHASYGSFPPAYVADASGVPLYSWRVSILPYMDERAVYNQYNLSEPWDGPNNIKLLDRMPRVFACPSRSTVWSNPTSLTSYVVITGPGTLFTGATGTRSAAVTDGLTNTLLIAEVANTSIPWTAPQDLDVRTMSLRVNDRKRSGISSPHPGGANIVMGDASYHFLSESIAPGMLKALITIAGGERIDVEQAIAGK
jgi:hypothetical protein